ncbi:Protein GLUTAMINE DUMPER 5 [Arabidopsis thaliana]|nr:hypothetical protein ISN45_At05g023540 [Arabidopsis thaliana x Arabidopsis arenosa]OAO94800.1 GDU5 [Arabidopsis thaliana]CAD5332617.1 unnamed protein product [Arabidopsis thaliana]VYS67844.1 unnamed protein product [Arabidopsis thaliana]
MRQFPNIRGNINEKMMTTMVESQTRSPWRTPVPYLFGGLAAMLGLIAFALLLLACSYWRISRQTEDEEKQTESGEKVVAKAYEEKILVIMAGQNNPTFLATPVAVKICLDCVNMEKKEGQIGESKVTEENH